MFSPENGAGDFEKILSFFSRLEKRPPINTVAPKMPVLKKQMSVRQAMLGKTKKVDIRAAVGSVLASPCDSSPPAIPIAVCGELIDDAAVECFEYYGINEVLVVK